MDKDEIPAGQFKTHCLRLLDEVSVGRSLIVTKHGKPVAKVSPVREAKKAKKPLFGCMKGTMNIHGDIVSAMDDVWDIDNWKFPY